MELNGMYGNQLAWTTLTATAKRGTTSLTVKGDVSAWPVGGRVAISSTDYEYTQAEERVITSVTKGGSFTPRIGLKRSSPLFFSLFGQETG